MISTGGLIWDLYVVMTGQLWSLATTQLQVGLKVELNTILFAKTLVRKDVATSSSSISKKADADAEDAPAALDAEASAAIRPEEPVIAKTAEETGDADEAASTKKEKKADEDEDFSSKSQIMTLMTTDASQASFTLCSFSR